MEIPHDQYVQIFNRLPRPIRDFLIDDELGKVVSDISKKYNLHVDTTGVLADIVTQMLMGLLNPMLAVDSMKNAGIPEDTARSITTDLNQSIFIPLRDRVRSEKGGEPVEISKKRDVVPVMNIGPEPIIEYSAPAKPVAVPVAAPLPAPIRTMAADMTAIQQHQEPAPQYFVPAQGYPHPSQPGAWQAAASVHVFVPSQQQIQQIPVAMPQTRLQAAPAAVITPQPFVAPTHTDQNASIMVTPATAPTPISKEYSADPYREPF